jgi:hypothetical protein
MTIPRIRSTGSRIGRQVGLIGAAVLLITACAAATGAGVSPSAGAAATGSGSTPTAAGATVGAGAPVGVSGNPTSVATVAGAVSSGMAIAYPYPGYPGSPGLAPDHTIVVTGFGQAPMAPDQSNRSAAQQEALKTALADAKAQADLVASTTGVTIKGVLSVSVSSSQGFIGPVPMMMGGGQTGSGSSGPVAPVPVPPQLAPTPMLTVTVTIAYRIG